MKIYNTLTKKKEELKTIEPNKIRMYVCGPTVYDFIHIGNARPMIIFDTFRRFMIHKGYDVNYISNFTDIDDKIINRANEKGIDAKEVAEKFIDECKKDMKELNIMPQTYAPKATEEVECMIDLIKLLVDKGNAYVGKDGTVYFDTKSFKEYGKLSHKNLDDLQSGFRDIKVSGEEDKKTSTDFVLWKPKKEGEPFWKSPFCDGRPGWHTECCVMAPKYAGGRLDIHAGGEDLIFPHHENEIAQYESAHNECFANYWMHNAFLNINNEKMSKSKGNFFTVRDITNKFDGRVLRFLMLQAHYRVGLNFSFEQMEQTKQSLERIINCVSNLQFIYKNNEKTDLVFDKSKSNLDVDCKQQIDNFVKIFDEKMEDDLNTADAITSVFEIVKIVNTCVTKNYDKAFVEYAYYVIVYLMNILGIDVTKELFNPENKEDDGFSLQVEKMIEERTNAKKEKDFAKADSIRDELKKMGVEIEDTRLGVKWHRI